MSNRTLLAAWVMCALLAGLAQTADAPPSSPQFRRLPVQQYVDKMKAGWVGQMVGVSWRAPTEFGYLARVVPADKVPSWRPKMVNDAFQQDDLYVEPGHRLAL